MHVIKTNRYDTPRQYLNFNWRDFLCSSSFGITLPQVLCFVFIVIIVFFSVGCVIYVCLQYFDTVGWVLRPVKNRRPYDLYCVGGDVKPCPINQSIMNHYL